jgi:hypothetical protein
MESKSKSDCILEILAGLALREKNPYSSPVPLFCIPIISRGFPMSTEHPLLRETLINLSQAARRIPAFRGSGRCHPSTIFRWLTTGVKLPNGEQLRLEGFRLAGRWLTSEQAVDRFLLAQNEAWNPEPIHQPALPIRTPTQRQRASERAAEELDELLGIRKCEMCRKVIEPGNRVIPKNEKIWCPDCLVKRKSATLGQRIRTFRWAAKLSTNALAQRTGISIDKLGSYESNLATPPDGYMTKLIEVLGSNLIVGLDSYTKRTRIGEQVGPGALAGRPENEASSGC